MTNYEFIGVWSDKDKRVIEAKIKRHEPEQAQVGFNSWQVWRQAGRSWVNFCASRKTWGLSQLNTSSAEGLARAIGEYYEAYEAVKVVQDDQ